MRAAAERVAEPYEAKGVKLRLLKPGKFGMIRGDADGLGDAISNLLLDALERREPGDAVNFACFVRAGEVAYKISGCSAAVDKRRMEARKIIEANGGEMRVEAAEGEGAAITCIFPIACPDADAKDGDRAS